MYERGKLRTLEQLSQAQRAVHKQSEAVLAEALAETQSKRDSRDQAQTAFEASLDDCRRLMGSSLLDAALLAVFTHAPARLQSRLAQASRALTAAERSLETQRLRTAQAHVIARKTALSERRMRKRLARKTEERALSAYDDTSAQRRATP